MSPSNASAQAPEDSRSVPVAPGTEIVVTARGREENIQSVPIVTAAFSGEQIDELGIVKLTDIANAIPNLTANSGFSASNPMFYIRGVGSGDYNDNAQSAVGIYLDKVYLGAPAGKFLQMFDIQDVQVLKGPQGTLFGRNNTAGALLMTSRAPKNELEGYVRLGIASFATFDLEAAASLPVTDDLAVRVAMQHRRSDGYGTLIDTAGDKIGTIGRIDEFAGRIIARYQSGDVSLTLNINGASADNERPPAIARPFPGLADFAGFIPRDPRAIYENQNGFRETERVRTFGAFLDTQYDPGPWKLSSITAYYHAHRHVTLDDDHSPLNTLHSARNVDSWQFSQEFKAALAGDGPFSAVAGLYFYREELNAKNRFAFFAPTPTPYIFQNYATDTTSFAGFAELIWRFASGWSLTGGTRLTYDRRKFALSLDPLLSGTASGVGADRRAHWIEPSWRAILDYKPTDDLMVYGSISRGFQGGGFNGGAFSIAELGDGFRPEFLTSYEIGAKTQLPGGRMVANLGLFAYDYKRPQVFTLDAGLSGESTVGVVQTITNARAARLYGFDFDLLAKVTDNLHINLGAGYVHSKYEGLILADQSGTIVRGDGNPFINAPEWSLNAGYELHFPIAAGTLSFRGDYRYTGRRYFDITGRKSRSGNPYALVNARAGFATRDGRLELAFFGRNLSNSHYLSFLADLSTNFGLMQEIWSAPRSFGGELTWRF